MSRQLGVPTAIAVKGRRPNHRKPSDLGIKDRRHFTPWLYILPTLILIIGIIYVGIGYTGWISLLNWNGIDASPKFVGFANYMHIAQDPVFWGAMKHVAIKSPIAIWTSITMTPKMATCLIAPQKTVS